MVPSAIAFRFLEGCWVRTVFSPRAGTPTGQEVELLLWSVHPTKSWDILKVCHVEGLVAVSMMPRRIQEKKGSSYRNNSQKPGGCEDRKKQEPSGLQVDPWSYTNTLLIAWWSSRKEKSGVTMWPRIFFSLGINPRKIKPNSHTRTCIWQFMESFLLASLFMERTRVSVGGSTQRKSSLHTEERSISIVTCHDGPWRHCANERSHSENVIYSIYINAQIRQIHRDGE